MQRFGQNIPRIKEFVLKMHGLMLSLWCLSVMEGVMGRRKGGILIQKTSNNCNGGIWFYDEELIWQEHKCEREGLVQLR